MGKHNNNANSLNVMENENKKYAINFLNPLNKV
jgi:hypothetical protein